MRQTTGIIAKMISALKTLLKVSLFLFVLALIPIGYAGWRYWQAMQYDSLLMTSQHVAADRLLSAVKDAKPFVCRGEATNFQNAGAGTTYVANGAMRTDTTYFPQNVTVHMIIRNSGETFVWQEGQQEGCRVTVFDQMAQDIMPQSQPLMTKHACVPWWFQDKTVFEPPSGVFFDDCSKNR